MTPTAIETQLPWKRTDENTDDAALKQNEFPAWASNKEYLAYNSPSATFLGESLNPLLIYKNNSIMNCTNYDFNRDLILSGSLYYWYCIE